MRLRTFALLLLLLAIAMPSAASDKPREKARDTNAAASQDLELVTNAIFAVVTQVFADDSCRTFAWYPDGQCRGRYSEIYCPGSLQTCMALHEPNSIPLCEEFRPRPGGPLEPEYQ